MDGTPDLKRRNFLLGRFAAEPARPAGPPVALIGPSCFALQGITCMSCRDACPTSAVRFELAIGGARPTVLIESCTGCGDCSQACPADAIRVSSIQESS